MEFLKGIFDSVVTMINEIFAAINKFFGISTM